MPLSPIALPIVLLFISNLFMTYAWYGHLRTMALQPIWLTVLVSWGVAFFEYCFQVPANRLGVQYYSLTQLKVIQEVLSMVVFAAFATLYLKKPVDKDFWLAGACLLGAVYFMFRKGAGS